MEKHMFLATVSFFSLFFLENGKENHQKTKDFFIPAEPLKSLEKKGKTLKKQGNLCQTKKKNKEFQENKERKDRVTAKQTESFPEVEKWRWQAGRAHGSVSCRGQCSLKVLT